MKLLHTADWHVGKVLKGWSRLEEQATVLAEIVAVAEREQVDLVVVAGDVFDVAAPAPDAQRLAWSTLLALRQTGADVVVVAGNHDPAEAFDAVAPVFATADVTMVGRPRRPDEGGVITLSARRTGEAVRLALLPFVSQRGIIKAAQLMELDGAQASGEYAGRVARVLGAMTAGFDGAAVDVLVHHATVRGGLLGGGERDAQTIFEYSIPATAFPGAASYVALGHLHRTQRLAAPCPAWYPGSPIAVDFGEQEDAKHVLIVEASPGRPAVVHEVPLATPRRLRTLAGTLAELAERADEVAGDLLRVVVREPARAGLADDVRALLPSALEVRLERPEVPGGASRVERGLARRTPGELFGAYCTERGVADERLERLFAELLDADLAGGA